MLRAALQMKDLAQRADVSLATLYRYFPAKDHVLLPARARFEIRLGGRLLDLPDELPDEESGPAAPPGASERAPG